MDMIFGLCLFLPFGIGYAISPKEALDLDVDMAEYLLEKKMDMASKIK